MGVFSLFSVAWNLLRGKKKQEKAKKKGRGPRGNSDPYYETVKSRNSQGQMVEKTVKRTAPDWFPAQDAKALDDARKWAYGCDMGFFSIGGFALGWETLIGFIPEFGDFIGVLLSLETYRRCKNIEGGLPDKLKSKMKRNITIDFLIGLDPLIGDIADGYFKANTKNVMMLEAYLRKKHGPTGEQNKRSRWSAGLRMHKDDPDYVHDLRHTEISPSSHQWEEYEDDTPAPAYSRRRQQTV